MYLLSRIQHVAFFEFVFLLRRLTDMATGRLILVLWLHVREPIAQRKGD